MINALFGSAQTQEKAEFEGEVSDFLAQLREFAESSGGGAVQCVAGPVLGSVQDKSGDVGGLSLDEPTEATHVVMIRFGETALLEEFLEAPVCAALLAGDPRLPLDRLLTLTFSVAPAQRSTSRQQQGGRILPG